MSNVARNIEFYIEGVSGPIPMELKKTLAREIFPRILHYVSARDPRVSFEGDLVFIDSEGIQVFDFGEGPEQLNKKSK